jgi:hypothetical protein
VLENLSIDNVAAGRQLGVNEASVRRWRLSQRGSGTVVHGRMSGEDRQRMHTRLDQVLDELNGEQVSGMRVSQWENVMRGQDGEPVITQLQGIKLDIKASQTAPDWPLVDRPQALLKVVPPDAPRPRHDRDRIAVILPDPQIGYRLFDDGRLDPFHDEDAIDVAMQIVSDLRPDQVVCLGDFQDFAEFGKYTQEAAFGRTTQRGIDRGHQFVAQMRAAAPDAELAVMEGNHDVRAEKRIRETNMAAWGLRRAADTTGWPVFSVPYLCAFDQFDCRYIGGYPAGEFWITPELRCIHGVKVRSGSSTAAAVVKDDGVSTIFGHVHRIETQYLSVRVRGGQQTRLAHTPGCLCRIDGSVPSVKSATSLDGRPVPTAENWQQGLSVVEYRQGRSSFALHSIHINTAEGYEARFNGRTYVPRRRKR